MNTQIPDLTPVSLDKCKQAINDISKITSHESKVYFPTIDRILTPSKNQIEDLESFILSEEPSGFEKLRTINRLDLTLEVFVLDQRFSEHFNGKVKTKAEIRLDKIGYPIEEPRYCWNGHSVKLKKS